MVAFALFAFLCGVVLSTRFTYFVLLPTFPVFWLAIVAAGMADGADTRWIIITCIAVTITLQLAYLVGVLMRASFLAAREKSRPEPETSGYLT
jgi:threonine/homoserine/homoserine lactone efflux protein